MVGSSANSQFRLQCDCSSLHDQQLGQHCHFWGHTEDRNSRERLLCSGTTGNSWGLRRSLALMGNSCSPYWDPEEQPSCLAGVNMSYGLHALDLSCKYRGSETSLVECSGQGPGKSWMLFGFLSLRTQRPLTLEA